MTMSCISVAISDLLMRRVSAKQPHICCREELLAFEEGEDLKHPPKDLEASGIYKYEPGRMICVSSMALLLHFYPAQELM